MQVAETFCFLLALAFLRWELGIWAGGSCFVFGWSGGVAPSLSCFFVVWAGLEDFAERRACRYE